MIIVTIMMIKMIVIDNNEFDDYNDNDDKDDNDDSDDNDNNDDNDDNYDNDDNVYNVRHDECEELRKARNWATQIPDGVHRIVINKNLDKEKHMRINIVGLQ